MEKIGFVDIDVIADEIVANSCYMDESTLLDIERAQLSGDGAKLINDVEHSHDNKLRINIHLEIERPDEDIRRDEIGCVINSVLFDAIYDFDSVYNDNPQACLYDRISDGTAFDDDVMDEIGRWLLGDEDAHVFE